MDRKILENLCYLDWDTYISSELTALMLSRPTIRSSRVVLCIITCIIGLPANLIVIFVTGFLMKKNKYKIWFLNLALADFAFLLILPFHATALIKGSWPFGSVMCKLYNFSDFANMYAGIYILIALNIDRALSVAKPIWHRRFLSKKFCWCMCAVIWVLVSICSSPNFIYSAVRGSPGHEECFFSFNHHHHYKSVESSSNYSKENQSSWFPDQRELCRDISNNIEMTAKVQSVIEVFKEERLNILHLVVSHVVFGYIIPLCVILVSNIIIAFHVKNMKMAATSRLYRVVIVAIMSYFCVWTPHVCACIASCVAYYTLQLTLEYKLSIINWLLFDITVINSFLNPVVYVLVGKQVKSELMNFLRKTL